MSKPSNTPPKAKFLMESVNTIESTFDSFGIMAKVAEINLQNDVVEYRIKIAPGISLSKIKGKANDIALALKSPTGKVKIEAPIPNTDQVGILVPLPKAQQTKNKKSYQILTVTKTVKVSEYSMAELLRDTTTSLFRAISKYSGIIAERVNQVGRKDQDDTNLS